VEDVENNLREFKLKRWSLTANDRETLASVVKEAQILRRPYCQGDQIKYISLYLFNRTLHRCHLLLVLATAYENI
jgi:hypothetical protein